MEVASIELMHGNVYRWFAAYQSAASHFSITMLKYLLFFYLSDWIENMLNLCQ